MGEVNLQTGAGSSADDVTWLGRLYTWATYRLYEELAWAYDVVSWLVSLGRWSEWRLSALEHIAGQQVLEIGFGTGDLLLAMAARGLQLVGLDASPAMQRVTGRKLRSRELRVPRVCGMAQSMPFADQSFDSVVCTFPAGYILEAATLCEAMRVLRPPNPITGRGGGRLVVVGIVVETGFRSWQRVVRLLFGTRAGAVRERFLALAQEAGLQVRVVEQEGGLLRVPVFVAERWR
jgi:ubiquinone/menaquinone biosynthesis C-methylase UbiE